MFSILNVLFLFVTAFLFALLRFIFQPYRNWMKQKKISGGLKELKVITSEGKFSFEDYQKRTNQKYVELSLIVPAYNEEKRIPIMLQKTIDYFQQQKINYEIIIVSDASKDKTVEVAKSYMNYQGQQINLKIMEYKINKGKGGAVRCGMFLASGKYKLFLDADGATDITEFSKIMKNMKEIEVQVENKNYGIVAGSRNHLQAGVIKQRKWYRNLLMHISNFIVNVICGVKLKDTQCGFKLFTQNSADVIFDIMHLERWAFDVELFMIANNYKFPIKEIPVNWKDVDGSKLNVIEASITMARDFLLVRLLYLFRIWRYTDSILN